METGRAGDGSLRSGSTRAIVLGGSGFIGRWVARTLSKGGTRVWCPVRDLGAARSVFERYDAGAEIVELDLGDTDGLGRLLDQVRPHVVYSLAGYGVDQRERDERLATAVNVELVRYLVATLPRLRDPAWPGQALIHTGSALEYGTVGGDLREETEPHPTTSYGKTKLAGSRIVVDAAERGVLPAVVARLFTVYGPGEHPGRLVPTLIEAAGRTERVPLSMGTQQRDFTYVEDVVEGLHRLAEVPNPNDRLMNLSTGSLMTVRRFIEIAAEVLGIAAERLGFGDIPTRPEEMQHEAVSIRRLERSLGWHPTTSVVHGLEATRRFGTGL